jgi:hypothetical protein
VKLIVIGAGVHAKVVTDTARSVGWEVVGFVDDRPNAQLFDLTYLDTVQNFQIPQQTQVVIAIGENKTREKIAAQLSGHVDWATVIHPRAIVSSYVKIDPDTVVFAGASFKQIRNLDIIVLSILRLLLTMTVKLPIFAMLPSKLF